MSLPRGGGGLVHAARGGGYCSVFLFFFLPSGRLGTSCIFLPLFHPRHPLAACHQVYCTGGAGLSHWVPSTPLCVWTARAPVCFPPSTTTGGTRSRRAVASSLASPSSGRGLGEWVARGVDVRRRGSRSTPPLARRCPHQRRPPPRRSRRGPQRDGLPSLLVPLHSHHHAPSWRKRGADPPAAARPTCTPPLGCRALGCPRTKRGWRIRETGHTEAHLPAPSPRHYCTSRSPHQSLSDGSPRPPATLPTDTHTGPLHGGGAEWPRLPSTHPPGAGLGVVARGRRAAVRPPSTNKDAAGDSRHTHEMHGTTASPQRDVSAAARCDTTPWSRRPPPGGPTPPPPREPRWSARARRRHARCRPSSVGGPRRAAPFKAQRRIPPGPPVNQSIQCEVTSPQTIMA